MHTFDCKYQHRVRFLSQTTKSGCVHHVLMFLIKFSSLPSVFNEYNLIVSVLFGESEDESIHVLSS